MLSRGILIEFTVTDDIDYHRPRWSLKFIFFLRTSIYLAAHRIVQLVQDYGATASWTKPWRNLDRALYESK
jgi:hypothetical protein